MNRVISILLIVSFLFMGCSTSTELRKQKTHWNIPEDISLRVELTNGDVYDFERGDFRVFKEQKAIKGLARKNSNTEEINQVVIPFNNINKAWNTGGTIVSSYVTVGLLVTGGIGIYLITK